MGDDELYVLKFYAENFKILEVVEFEPDPHVTRIVGDNGQGKTSVIDAVEWTLTGGRGRAAPKRPLRKGQERGRIRIELGGKAVEYIATRRFTDKNEVGELRLELPSGAILPQGQSVLDQLTGRGDFGDPLAFMAMDPDKQFEVVRRGTVIKEDIEALRGQIASDMETRRDVNREARRLRGEASGIAYPADTPAVAPDIAAATEALSGGSEMNTARERMIAERTRRLERAATLRAQAEVEEGPSEAIASVERQHNELVANARSRIAALEAEIALQRLAIQSAEEVLPEAIRTLRQQHADRAAMLRAAADEAVDGLPEIPDEVDIGALTRILQSAQQIKGQVDARNRRETLEAEAAALENRSAFLTESIEDRERRIAAAIAEAKMPVEGLGLQLDPPMVLFNGIPLSQASDAEKLIVSTEIVCSQQRKVKIVLVRNGSLLDDKSLSLVAGIAHKHRYQLWVEQVGEGRQGFLLRAGHLVAQPEPVAPQLALE